VTRAKEKDYVAIAGQYAADVVSRKIPACQWAVKACRRQLDDLGKEKRGEFPYRFDHEKASRICRFIEMLPHIKGEWAKSGSRIELQPWQVFILTAVFGWVSKQTGLRRFRIAYLEMPRKNGKGLGLDTPIPTSTGWTTMGDLSVGDTVFGTDGQPREVTAVSETCIDHDCYRIRFSNSESVTADAGHLWKTASGPSTEIRTSTEIVRSSAVRNLERAGVPRSVAMILVGHKTESIYRRYAIVARQDLVDGLKRLAEYRAGLDKTPAEPKVVEIREAAS
jgi:hypothetical protein